jgi:transposase-like protein
MAITRRKFTSEFKTKVVLEAIKERSTLAELSKKYELSGVLISRWKNEFLDRASLVFSKELDTSDKESEEMEKLYAQIGKLKVEVDFLKKSCAKLGI